MKLSPATALRSTVHTAFFVDYFYDNLYVLVLFTLLSQNKSAEITGRLLNLNQEPVPYSTIALFDSDSVLIRGAISDADGNFILQNIVAGTYKLMITNIEYETYVVPVLTLSEGEVKEIGTLNLQESKRTNG